MARRFVLLSGPIASGKTTLGSRLQGDHGVRVLKTRELILALRPDIPKERAALQAAGEELDKKEKGTWVAQALGQIVADAPEDAVVLVDSVRIAAQVEAVRKAFGSRVSHVHLTAATDALAKRYADRPKAETREFGSYAEARKNPTEAGVDDLGAIADVCIDTQRCDAEDVAVRVAAHLGLFGRGVERLVDVLIGGQYGSEGKGHVASYLAPEYAALVRVGGPNAGHKVWWEPQPYTFHQLPSGTLHSEAQLIIGAGAVLNPETVLKEAAECGVSAKRLAIDPRAMIIDPADIDGEKGLVSVIGSTGKGVGNATSRKVLRTSAVPPVQLAKDVPGLSPFVKETADILDRIFRRGGKVMLEGTQGTGLSLHHGSYPHVTSRDTSVGGCVAEAGIAPTRVRRTIMVCRTFPIRVESPTKGTSGPMRSETAWSEVERRAGAEPGEFQTKEFTSTTNRQRRVGEFDWSLLRKSAALNGPTDVALTFADYLSVKNRDARRFEQLTMETMRFVEEVERVACAPVSLITTRFHSRSIIDRRNW